MRIYKQMKIGYWNVLNGMPLSMSYGIGHYTLCRPNLILTFLRCKNYHIVR